VGKFAMRTIAAMLAVCGAGSAAAETLTVTGWYAAEDRGPAMLRSIGVDRFDGDEGPMIASAIERELGYRQGRDGRPYFIVRSRYGNAEGMVHGDLRLRTNYESFKRKVKRCVADTSSTKCKDKEKVEVDIYCDRRIITATANVKITRLADDATIYNRTLSQRDENEICEGDRPESHNMDSIVQSLTRDIARQLAGQITPYGSTDKIRIRESRSGLSKEDGNQMKALIAATKTNEGAACAGWREMEARGVSHSTLTFNLGLCAESAGELDEALNYYRPLSSSADGNESIRRVNRRIAGEEDDRRRNAVVVTP
jgi:hypothetical protein